jgi:ATP-dependent DNA helicase RecQ
LELEGILHCTGPFYTEFKFQPLRSSAEILQKFDAARAEFVRSILQLAKKGRTWFSLDADAASRTLQEPRERIITALNYLEEQGDLIVQATGVRVGYRRLQQPTDRTALAELLIDRFLQRETHDIARVESVVALAEHDACITQHLLEYFGESRAECGHCCRCEGEPAKPMNAPPAQLPKGLDVKVVRKLRAEGNEALRSPRQLARFLCGISSPASTRAKLRNRPEFGQWSHVRFADVLAVTSQT